MWVQEGKMVAASKEKVEEWLTDTLPMFLKAMMVKVYRTDGKPFELEVKVKE